MNFCGESMQIHYISSSRPFYEMHEWVAFPCSLAPLFHDVFVKSQPNRVTSAQIGGIAAPRRGVPARATVYSVEILCGRTSRSRARSILEQLKSASNRPTFTHEAKRHGLSTNTNSHTG